MPENKSYKVVIIANKWFRKGPGYMVRAIHVHVPGENEYLECHSSLDFQSASVAALNELGIGCRDVYHLNEMINAGEIFYIEKQVQRRKDL